MVETKKKTEILLWRRKRGIWIIRSVKRGRSWGKTNRIVGTKKKKKDCR